MYLFSILFACLYTNVEFAASETFSSTADLIKLVEKETGVLPLLYQYVADEEKFIKEIYSYIEDIESANNYVKNYNSSLFYAGHPVNAYNLIKRWYKISELYTTDSRFKRNRQRELAAYMEKLPPVSQYDFTGANAAILRLQRVFNLSAEQVASGSVYGQSAAHKLSPDDCLSLGQTALINNEYDLAVDWLSLAEPGINTPEQKLSSESAIRKALEKIGNIKKAYHYAEAALKLDPDDIDLNAEVVRLNKLLTAKRRPTAWRRTINKDDESYERLCRGEPDGTSDPEVAKDLLCYYKKGRIPYVQYKHEVLSWNPRIGLIYDVISDKDTETIIKKANPSLSSGMIVYKGIKETVFRVSKIAWLWDIDRFVKKLSDRVEDITGLETSQPLHGSFSTEAFQVVNYGMGGQYVPHVDYFKGRVTLTNEASHLKNTGDRLATFLIYLSDVRAGGATVFTRANITVAPVKNAAVFWYNAKLSGDFDVNTTHAGCPLLLGEKWVVTKWFREYGQEFRHRCGLHRNAIDTSIE